MEDSSINSFKEKLDKEYDWPSLYTFKFIVPKGKADEVRNLFSNHNTKEKSSSNGNYISVTAEVMVQSSDKVIEYYLEANKVEGIIAL
ncbi:DUF493 domain-containing protein [Fulvivirga ulvae]|uniref:DUF493 family protein n=1 Tax=Fulvivirga ulvae TaxID=2904245 RepID=UPI001F1FA9B5|nr:DUF493 family protein [Fulvivirga ulvae]UII33468.1 DUF493 domain-containing protein [Fulvivirga ulvae]